MNNNDLLTLLNKLTTGELQTNQVAEVLKNSIFRKTELEYAKPDHHRELRHGLNEVIYGEGKTSEQICQIAAHLCEHQRCVLISRLDLEKIKALKETFPNGRINEIAKTFMINPPAILSVNTVENFVAIISAGTSDIPVAEEASEVCVAMKVAHQKIYDVGVAGIHRVMDCLETMQKASAIIVIAGMEGALPSVVGGLIATPVIAVPTSIGYGASFKGISALLGMLNSCAPGVTVTNIDAGFSAGFAAARIINGMKKNENALS